MNLAFKRETKGDPLVALADMFRNLTFDEMTTFADGIGVDPRKVNEWWKLALNAKKAMDQGVPPEAHNDNTPRPTLDLTAGMIPTPTPAANPGA